MEGGLICLVYLDPTVTPWVRNETQCPFNPVFKKTKKQKVNPGEKPGKPERGQGKEINNMPIYSFHCPYCHRHFDVITIRAEWDKVRCECGKKPKKLMTTAAFRINGANAKNSYGLKTGESNDK